ncbi:MAG: hypothetical protein CMP91_06755 [Gammaproteobacteria bacterium]|nr:hypothetical protein [Gammaproteobacteria bacterium]|tara:strand:- start:542 stop:778 length:237 start_codon:yes stop_codon:yes gene_type:complete
MKDRRSANPESQEVIPQALNRQARQQLEKEISILQGWLKDLNETRDDNPEAIIARKFYDEMIQNRQELLDTLKLQQKN